MVNLKNILLFAIVIVSLYFVYSYVFLDSTSNVLYKGGNAKNSYTVKANKLPGSSDTVDFTYSVWIYVKDWQHRYGVEKVIWKRPGPDKDFINVSLAGSTNALKTTLGIISGEQLPIEIDNIPIQKWTHILISTNNRSVDSYIDGKLVKTTVLDNMPKTEGSETSDVLIVPKGTDQQGGFSGEISKFRYISRTVNPREAYEIYREGPGGSWLSDLFNKYKLKLSFLKDNEEVQSFSL